MDGYRHKEKENVVPAKVIQETRFKTATKTRRNSNCVNSLKKPTGFKLPNFFDNSTIRCSSVVKTGEHSLTMP